MREHASSSLQAWPRWMILKRRSLKLTQGSSASKLTVRSLSCLPGTINQFCSPGLGSLIETLADDFVCPRQASFSLNRTSLCLFVCPSRRMDEWPVNQLEPSLARNKRVTSYLARAKPLREALEKESSHLSVVAGRKSALERKQLADSAKTYD